LSGFLAKNYEYATYKRLFSRALLPGEIMKYYVTKMSMLIIGAIHCGVTNGAMTHEHHHARSKSSAQIETDQWLKSFAESLHKTENETEFIVEKTNAQYFNQKHAPNLMHTLEKRAFEGNRTPLHLINEFNIASKGNDRATMRSTLLSIGIFIHAHKKWGII
jgi:hypothetical protein